MTTLVSALPVVAGDEAVAPMDFEVLYRAEFPRLVGALHLYCGDLELAHDFVQEAMARACRDWEKVGRTSTPSAWVYRVAMNLASSWFRRVAVARRAARRHEGGGARVHLDRNAASHLVLRDAIASLPRRERQALVLRYVADLTIDATAEVMRCAPGTVKALTSRAKAKLRVAGLDEREEPA